MCLNAVMTSWITTMLMAALLFDVVMTSELKPGSSDVAKPATDSPENETNSIPIQNRLKENLLTGYRKDTIPTKNHTATMNVSVFYMLMAISDLDEVEEKLSAAVYMSYRWIDESLTWNSSLYEDIDYVTLDSNLVWKPNVRVENAHHAVTRTRDIEEEYPVEVDSSGTVLWYRDQILHATCNFDLTYFPFDMQVCNILLTTQSWRIKMKFRHTEYSARYVEPNGAWNLDNFNMTDSEGLYLSFRLHRKPTFVVVNVLLPIIVLVFLTPMVFMLSKDSGERVSYAVTVLLAISVYMTILSDNLPANSDPMPLLSIFLLVFYIITAFIGLVLIFNFKILKAKETRPVPMSVKRFVVVTRCLFGCSPCRSQAVAQQTELPQTEDEERCLSGRVDKETDKMTGNCHQRTDIRWVDVSNSVDLVCMCLIYLIEIGLFLGFYISCVRYHLDNDGDS